VAATHWKVEHNCPQCGGPIALTEDERVLTCGYCRVRLFVASDGGPIRYAIPPRHAGVGTIVMVPYWRMRGQMYKGDGLALTPRLLDGTRLASPSPGLPPTLGVRPQAMPLCFASAALSDRYLTPTLAPQFSAVRRMRKAGARLVGDPHFDIPLVPVVSIVYQPVRLSGGVFDAVGSRRLGSCLADEWVAQAGTADAAPPVVRFLPTLCPWCSWQLDCHPVSHVLTCGLCRSAYVAGERALVETAYLRLPSDGWQPVCHAPFWRARAETPGLELESLADLVRFANLPLVPRVGWEHEPIDYWVPAFPTSPDQFLRFARTMTMARIEPVAAGRQHEAKPMAEPGPVTVPASCLPNAVKVLLADLAHPKITVFPQMADLSPRVTRADLVYVPLADGGTEFVHPGSELVVHRNVLRR
jgi:DNA-directed RNA polymerase subunit RPC12/RpoP